MIFLTSLDPAEEAVLKLAYSNEGGPWPAILFWVCILCVLTAIFTLCWLVYHYRRELFQRRKSNVIPQEIM